MPNLLEKMADPQWGLIAALLVMVASYILSLEFPQAPWLIAMAAAAFYGISVYLKKMEGENPEKFDVYKFGGTVVVGLLIGAILYNAGIPVSEQELIVQIGIYAGAIALVENFFRFAWRWIEQRRQPPTPA